MGEVELMRLAARQQGAFSRAQALQHVTRDQLKRRVQSHRWARVLPETFRIEGTPETWEHALTSAALWLERGFAFSHQTAAALLGLRGFAREGVHVSVNRDVRAQADVTLHRIAMIHPKDVIILEGRRVTSPCRTVIDLAAVLPEKELRATVDEALSKKWITVDKLEATLERTAALPGTPALRRLIHEYRGGDGPSESKLEDLVYGLIERYQLPRPIRQRTVYAHGRFRRLDLLFEAYGVVIEADGYASHSDVGAFERDRQRANSLVARGFVALQWTWVAINERPDELVAELCGVLRARERP